MIIAGAMRLWIEPAVAPGISDSQCGFLRGRSMLANLVDIDEAILHVSLEYEDAAAIFFDFEAALPS
eukprot:4522305-Pyramimonas_sp.AAC.1